MLGFVTKLFKKKEKPVLKKKEYPQMKFSVKSVVMFEEITGKDFNKMEEQDTAWLLYCVFVCSTDIKISFEAFCALMEEKEFAEKFTNDLVRLQKFSSQFNKEKGEGGEGKSEGFSITAMVDKLIFSFGMDVSYVMEKMELWELNHFFDGAISQYREKMEEQRLWTFLQVAPQIDLKKVKTPEKFLPFAWEQENMKKKQEKELEKETKIAKDVIGMDISSLFKNKNEE